MELKTKFNIGDVVSYKISKAIRVPCPTCGASRNIGTEDVMTTGIIKDYDLVYHSRENTMDVEYFITNEVQDRWQPERVLTLAKEIFTKKENKRMIISDLILLLKDELEIEGDIPVCISDRSEQGFMAVDVYSTTAHLVNSPNKYLLLLGES